MYPEPRVPILRDGQKITEQLRELVRFLRGFSQEAWNADRMKDKEIESIKRRLDRLEEAK